MNTNVMNLVASVVSGALGGSLMGVFLAARIAEHTEAGRRRHKAKANLLCDIATYRYTITVLRQERAVHPIEYLSPEKVKAWVDILVRELPYLNSIKRRQLRRLLVKLAGSTTVLEAEGQRFIRSSDRPVDQQKEAVALMDLVIRNQLNPPRYQDYGILGALNEERENVDRQSEVVKTLDRMMAKVSPAQRLSAIWRGRN